MWRAQINDNVPLSVLIRAVSPKEALPDMDKTDLSRSVFFWQGHMRAQDPINWLLRLTVSSIELPMPGKLQLGVTRKAASASYSRLAAVGSLQAASYHFFPLGVDEVCNSDLLRPCPST